MMVFGLIWYPNHTFSEITLFYSIRIYVLGYDKLQFVSVLYGKHIVQNICIYSVLNHTIPLVNLKV